MKRKVDIDDRTLKFSVEIIRLVALFPKSVQSKVIADQLVRSATSIGANIQEALGAHTRTEYIYRVNIAKK